MYARHQILTNAVIKVTTLYLHLSRSHTHISNIMELPIKLPKLYQ